MRDGEPKEEILNAVIKKAYLGKEPHGIMTLGVELDYGGVSQYFGGWDLRRYEALGFFITSLMKAADVASWEELEGRAVRVKRIDRIPVAIGHYLHDFFFSPRDAFTASEHLK